MSIQLIDCPACGNKVSTKANACPHCGQPIPTIQSQSPDMITCQSCKKSIPAKNKYCPECGALISGQIPWWIWLLIISLVLKFLAYLIKKGII